MWTWVRKLPKPLEKKMNSFEEIFDEIKNHDTFYLSGHKNPDGDSIGSCKCLQLALESLGSEAMVAGVGGTFTWYFK